MDGWVWICVQSSLDGGDGRFFVGSSMKVLSKKHKFCHVFEVDSRLDENTISGQVLSGNYDIVCVRF